MNVFRMMVMNAILLVLMMNKADGQTPRSSIVKLSRTISKRNDTISGIHQQHETSFETTLAALQTRGGTLTARMNNRASPRRWQRRRFGMYTALTYIILYHVVVKYGPIAFIVLSNRVIFLLWSPLSIHRFFHIGALAAKAWIGYCKPDWKSPTW